MPNVKRVKIFLVILLGLCVSGCAGLKAKKEKISIRAYAQDTPRVDQEFEGNAGYLSGTPKPDDSNRKMTRKIYVLEVNEAVDELPDSVYQVDLDSGNYESSMDASVRQTKKNSQSAPKINIPKFDDSDFEVEAEVAPTEQKLVDYVVEKDDTLQKISKKFFGSFSKWPQIYELNRDVIANPDRLKPGITIRIPVNQ